MPAAVIAPSTAGSFSSSADSIRSASVLPGRHRPRLHGVEARLEGALPARSIVFHEHRGTIGKKFSQQIHRVVLKKNFVLFCWKNIHEWPRFLGHFFFAWADAVVSAVMGDSPERTNLAGLWRALLQLPGAFRLAGAPGNWLS